MIPADTEREARIAEVLQRAHRATHRSKLVNEQTTIKLTLIAEAYRQADEKLKGPR